MSKIKEIWEELRVLPKFFYDDSDAADWLGIGGAMVVLVIMTTISLLFS